MTMTKTKYFAIILAIVVIADSVSPTRALAGDERASIAGVGMARTFVATARGLEAIGTNPADLTLPHRGRYIEYEHRTVTHDSLAVTRDSTGNESTQTISVVHDTLIEIRQTPPAVTFTLIPSFGLNLRTDFVNYDIYNQYFTGLDTGGSTRASFHLNDADKNNVLGIFPAGIAETHSDIDVRLFGLTIHNDFLGDIGLTITDRAALNFDLPRDYVRFAFFGLDTLGSSYDLSGTNVRAWYLREYAFSYAHRLPDLKFIKELSAGFSLKLIQGYAVAITDKYNARFGNTLTSDSLGQRYILNGSIDFKVLRAESDNFTQKSSFTPFPTPAGKGFGIDLGVSGQILQGIQVGLSVTDIGSVDWTENTKQTTATAAINMTNLAASDQAESLKTAFKGNDTTTGSFSTPLPTSLRLGAAIQVDHLPFVSWFPGQWLLAFEYQQGFNNSPGNSTRARLSFGTEYRPVSFLPLRTGISFGGIDRFNWAGGFGLDFNVFVWNFGTENIGVLFTPSSYQQLSFGTSMLIRI